MTGPEHGPDVDFVDVVSIGAGMVLCLAVRPAEPAWPWLVVTGPDAPRLTSGCACPLCAPHEGTGPLPARYLDRIQETP